MPSRTTDTFALPAGFKPQTLTVPARIRGIVQAEPDGKPTISDDMALGTPTSDQIVVKVIAVAVNPYDWKMPANFPSPGARIGCDFYGEIAAIGPDAGRARPDLQLADRVCGAVFGSNPLDHTSGSFCDFTNIPADLVVRLSHEFPAGDAAAIGGTALSTLALSLWDSLKLEGTLAKPLDQSEDAPHVLVYGGSTATGTMALQLLRLAGYKPITTCSPHNFALVKQYGAEAAFDYHSSTCGADIKAYTNNSLGLILDIITDLSSQSICYGAMSRGGGIYSVLEAPSEALNTRKRTVRIDFVVGLCALGGEVSLPGEYHRPADPVARQHAAKLFNEAQAPVQNGVLKPHPFKKLRNGWEGVLEGIFELSRGKVSGQRLVSIVA